MQEVQLAPAGLDRAICRLAMKEPPASLVIEGLRAAWAAAEEAAEGAGHEVGLEDGMRTLEAWRCSVVLRRSK